MKLTLIATLGLLLMACDPMDDRLIFYNNTDDDILVRFCFIGEGEIYETWAGIRSIARKESKKIGIIGTWESEFEQVAPIEKIHVIVYSNHSFYDTPTEQNIKARSDSLLRIGDCKYKEYSYEDLVLKKWGIIYPGDGFKKVSPMSTN